MKTSTFHYQFPKMEQFDQTTKSHQINLLLMDHFEPQKQFDTIVIDGSTANIKTFNNYAESVFIPPLFKFLEKCNIYNQYYQSFH